MNSLCATSFLLVFFFSIYAIAFWFLFFLKLLLPRLHTSESNLIQVDSVLLSVQFKVIFFGSQQNITESLTELLRIFTPYQQLISNYFSAHLKILKDPGHDDLLYFLCWNNHDGKLLIQASTRKGVEMSAHLIMVDSALSYQKLKPVIFLGPGTMTMTLKPDVYWLYLNLWIY